MKTMKKEWRKPEVKRIAAGSAENGGNTGADKQDPTKS
jgi:hypothetical protein